MAVVGNHRRDEHPNVPLWTLSGDLAPLAWPLVLYIDRTYECVRETHDKLLAPVSCNMGVADGQNCLLEASK